MSIIMDGTMRIQDKKGKEYIIEYVLNSAPGHEVMILSDEKGNLKSISMMTLCLDYKKSIEV